MNDNKVTLTPADRAQIDAWLTEIRAIYADVAAPFTENDSRLAAFPKGYPLDGLDAEALGSMHFHVTKPELPAWPLALPAWAVSAEVMSGTYPEIQVEIVGKAWEYTNDDGDKFSARVEQFATIYADDDDAHPDVMGVIERGSFDMGAPTVVIGDHSESLSWWDAKGLSIVIEDAADQLRDFLAD